MSQEIAARAVGQTAELARPNPNPARGLTRHIQHPMDDFGSGNPVGPDEMQEFSFFDFLDIINPLQHIPVVSSLYRALTGDELKPFARVIGGLLFGGPTGLVRGVAEAVLEQSTGKDIGQHVAGMIGIGADDEPAATLRLAAAPAAPVGHANVPAVVALGLETLADGPSEWAMAQPAGAADHGIAGGVADARLLGDSEPLPSPPGFAVPTADAASAARLKAFVATEPGAPIDKATLKWLIEATPIVSAAAAAFGRPGRTGPEFVAVAPPALDDVESSGASAAAMAVTAPSISPPAIDDTAPTPPSLDLPLEERQSSRQPERQRVPVLAFGREEFYEGTFRTGPRQWPSPVMIAEPAPTAAGDVARPSVAAADPDLPAIPTVPTRTPARAAAARSAPLRQLAAAGLTDLPAVPMAPEPKAPAVAAGIGEPLPERPSRPPVHVAIARRHATVAPASPPPKPTAVDPRDSDPPATTPEPVVEPVQPAPPTPAADSPRADHDEAEIAVAAAAWLRSMPAAPPMPAALAELEAPALRHTMTATPAPPAAPPPTPEAAAVDSGPTEMLSTELLAQVMMSNLDRYEELARRRTRGRVVKAGLN